MQHNKVTTTSVVQQNDIQTIIEDVKVKFINSISGQNANERYLQECGFAVQLLSENKKLYDTAKVAPKHVQYAIMNIANLDITLNPALKQCYLVPFDKVIKLCPSYIGLIALATKSGSIQAIETELVYSNDVFKPQKFSPPIHEYDVFAKKEERGKIRGVYCTVKTAHTYQTEYMSIEDVYKVRDCSSGFKYDKYGNNPWNKHEDRMIKKTVIKRGATTWPSVNPKVLEAIKILDEMEGEDYNQTNQESYQIDKDTEYHINMQQKVKRDEEKKECIVTIKNLMKVKLAGITSRTEAYEMLCKYCGINDWDELNSLSIEKLKEAVGKLK